MTGFPKLPYIRVKHFQHLVVHIGEILHVDGKAIAGNIMGHSEVSRDFCQLYQALRIAGKEAEMIE
ncbi:hypothetical protein MSTO_01270 [Mycobacterium stomatepiae]|uniref:Uncharacterized protein n=1 Tax=Mycobacterium stomatepiae TaxID=470076 RepID=A0A7I7Q1F8_9MYCO|nr:hypothetical protein MSTO_01270 [Mycobacterium stomatepiae]